ncbi:MAG: hypothetical protein IPH31_22075 [Lewinellaceae bacterium]|nr:hypothetical protein [Lewinellaceae bacterium]
MDQRFNQMARSFIHLLPSNVGMKYSYVCLNKPNHEMALSMVHLHHSMVQLLHSNDGMELPFVCLDEPNHEMALSMVDLRYSHDGMEHFNEGLGEINIGITGAIHGFRQDVVEMTRNLYSTTSRWVRICLITPDTIQGYL